MAGPTISRGAMYGVEEGHQDAVAEASGPVVAGASPALYWVAFLGLLILLRLLWEQAD